MAGPWEDFAPSATEQGPWSDFSVAGTSSTAKKQNASLVGDIGTGLKRGIEQLPGMVTGIADLAVAPVSKVTGVNKPFSLVADWAGEKTGFQPGKWADAASDEYSPEMREAQANVDKAEGFFPTIQAIAQNPRYAANIVAESLPSTLAGGLVARGAMGAVMGAKRLAATRAAAAAGDATARNSLLKAGSIAVGIGEGAVTAGQQMEQSGADVDPLRAAGSALGAGVGTGVLGAAGGRLATKLGLPDIDTALATGTLGDGVQTATTTAGKIGNVAKRMAVGGVQEGVFEELPQSAQEQVWQNIASGKPWDEGISRAMAEGLVAGTAMGAGVNALPRRAASQPETVAEEAPIAGFLPPPVSSGTPSDQVLQSEVERANSVAAAQANADAIYAEREAFEKANPNLAFVPTQDGGETVIDSRSGPLSAAAVSAVKSGATAQLRERDFVPPPAGSFGQMNEFADLIGSERADVEGRRNALSRNQQLRRDSEIETADARVEQARLQETAGKRSALLMNVLEHLPEGQNPSRAFDRALRTLGFTDTRFTPEETRTLNNWKNVSLTPQEPESIPAAPNALNPAALGIRSLDERQQKIEANRLKFEQTRRAAAEKKGSAPPAQDVAGEKLSREWTAFSPETGTLGVPRAEMPQIQSKHRGAMTNFMNARGVEHQQDKVLASSLRPTQAEFSPNKVAKALGFIGNDRSILVSSDNYVLDGHHQWLAKRENNEPIKIIRLDAPIRQLIPLAHEFPSSKTAKGATAPINQPGEISNGPTTAQAIEAAPQEPQEQPAAAVIQQEVRDAIAQVDAPSNSGSGDQRIGSAGNPSDSSGIGSGRGDDAQAPQPGVGTDLPVGVANLPERALTAKAYPKGQAQMIAGRMTRQGLPSEVYPHPTQAGMFAIRPQGQPAAESVEQPSPTAAPATQRNSARRMTPIMRRDDLVGAIMRVTGGNGIAASMADTLTGEKANAATKLRGLFTSQGQADMDDLAMLLREEEGFDVRDASHLEDLIREAAAGNVARSMARQERDAQEDQDKQYRDQIRARAKKYGIKTVAVKFSELEKIVLQRLEDRHNQAVAQLDDRSQQRFNTALEEAMALVPEEVVDETLADVNRRGLRAREFWNEATRILRGMIYDAKQEASNGTEQPTEEIGDGRGNSGTGRGTAADQRDQAPAGQADERAAEPAEEQRPGLALEGQTPAEVRAQEAQRQAEEARANRPEPDTSPRVKADQVDLFNTQGGLFSSNRDAQSTTADLPRVDTVSAPVASTEQAQPDQSADGKETVFIRKGDRFKDGQGKEYEVWDARTSLIEAFPVINGKIRVSNETGSRFATDERARFANPEARTDFFPIEAKKKIVTPQLMTQVQFNSVIQIAADSIAKLRRIDVDRVLQSTPEAWRLDMAGRIKDARPDLAQEVDSVMAEDGQSPVDAAAHEAATSPQNDTPEPSQAQKEAGNYKVGRVKIAGLDISIENPEGSTRSGTDPNGKPWSITMQSHYGYIRKTEGRDGDHVDVFVKPGTAEDYAGQVFVIDQRKANGHFDEHKVMLGWPNEEEAKAAYLANYAKGWTGLGAITPMSMEQFKAWVDTGDQTHPMAPKTLPERVAANKQKKQAENAERAAKLKDVMARRKAEGPATGSADQAKIEDFGEKIGGARKDVWTSLKDSMSAVPDSELASHPLSKSWPEPNYQALLDNGADPWAVAFMHAARDEVPRKPSAPWKLKRWADQVRVLREMTSDLIEGKHNKEFVQREMKSGQLSKLASRIELYELVGHEKSLAGISYAKHHYSLYKGRSNVTIWTVEKEAKATAMSNWPTEIATADTREELLDRFKSAYASLGSDKQKSKEVSFDLYSQQGQFFVGKKAGRNIIQLAGPFATVKEAREHREANKASLLAKLEKAKEIPNERRDSNNPRVGEDMRGGQDVTPQMFGESFGFRGVEFGNWVEQSKRQSDLNEAYDALMDLAAVLGVPPKALSLNGELGLAFGARGSGGKNSPKAHYEPGRVVINLTKKEGSGSLGHEWWHALDNYFARLRGRPGDAMTTALDVSLSSRKSAYQHQGAVRKEMIDAFGSVVRAIKDTAIKARSSKLDAKRTKEYWTTGEEMSARAFESYLIAKLQDQNAANDYLANIVDEATWKAAESLGFELDESYPYPTAGELPTIRAAFDNFFQTIQTKQTENGIALQEESAVYTVNEPDPISGDLFQGTENALPAAAGKNSLRPKPGTAVDRSSPRAVLAVREAPDTEGLYNVQAQLVTVGERRLPVDSVNSPEDAARAFAHLSRFAVEHMDGLVTDKNGKPLAVIGALKGAPTQASIYPSTILMELSRIDGAANLWLSHNHPSGRPDLSAADMMIAESFGKILRGTNITFRGVSAMARTGNVVNWSDSDYNNGSVDANEPAPHRVAIVEREIVESNPGAQISSPSDAKRLVAEIAKDRPGVLFTTAQNAVASFVPFEPSEMGELRSGDRLMRLFRAAARSGGTGAFVAMPDGRVLGSEFSNIKGALSTIDVRVLDGIEYSSDGSGKAESLAEKGLDISSGASFYNQANDGRITPADKAIYGMAAEGKSTTEILKFIADTSRNPFNRQLAKLLQKMNLSTSIGVGESKGWKFNAGEGKYAAAYNPKTDTAALFRPASSERNVLHELMHAATLKALQKKGLAAAQMRALFQHVERSGKLRGMYGMSNVDEFVAEAFTNPKFQQALKKVKANNTSTLKSAWHWFVRVVRGILGMNQGQENALSQALEIGVELMRENMRVWSGRSLRLSSVGSGDIASKAMTATTGQSDSPSARTEQLRDGNPSPKQPLETLADQASDSTIDDSGIRYNVADEGWSVSEPSKMDDVIYALQDKHVDTKRVVQSIMKAGKKIRDAFNPYLQEELFHGRAAKGVKDFLDLELRPLLAEMQRSGIDMGDFEEYLWNRHAPERNAQIAKINPEMKDGGSGIKTADAKAYLSGLSAEKKAAFDALAKRIDAINRNSQAILVSSGLEKQETIDAWNGAYKHYVPLQREDVDSGHVGTGKGFSVRGSSTKRAMGSGKQVVDIIANITLQRERNIVRAEKNRVSNALMGLALENENADFWQVDKAPKERVVNEKAIYTVLDAAGKKVDEFTRMVDAEKALKNVPDGSIDQTWGDRVEERVVPGFTSRDNVVLTRVNGEDHYIIFNERNERAMRMAAALKNLDADNLGRVLSVVGKATRYLASINTQYNPVFGIINLIRDAQGALLNLSSTPLAGDQKRVLGYTKDALVGIYKDIRAHRSGKKPSSNWADLFEEFQREGGQTGYRDQYANAEQRAEAIRSELKQFSEGKAKQLTRGVFGWLSDYNETMENAVRLAAYKAAKEKGISNQQAASIAKNITVNFNRKGQMATQVGALYAFFNASVQGTARIAETLFEPNNGDLKSIRLSKVGKRIITGGLMLGSMQAMLLAAAGYDDDEPPDFVRERNLILPIGDRKYLTLAMPLGFHVLPGIGRVATEFVLSGGKQPMKQLAALSSMFADTFNPIGNAGFSLQTITPSVVDPFAALAENKDFTGKEIYRENFNSLNPQTGNARAKDVATFYSKMISASLNWITGGSEFRPGMLSPSPDAIDYLIGQVTGGVGREANKVFQTGDAIYSGEDLPLHKVPLVGRFIGDTQGQSGQSQRFYEGVRQLNMLEAEYKGLLKSGRRQEAAEFMAENPGVRLIMMGNYTENQVRKLREQKRALVKNDAPTEAVQSVDQRIMDTMRKFNERVSSVM